MKNNYDFAIRMFSSIAKKSLLQKGIEGKKKKKTWCFENKKRDDVHQGFPHSAPISPGLSVKVQPMRLATAISKPERRGTKLVGIGVF